MQVSLLQCQSSRKPAQNLAFIAAQLELLPRQPGVPQLVLLPESCLLFGGHEGEQLAYAHVPEGAQLTELAQQLAALAAAHQVYLAAGTVPVASSDGRVYSRSYLFDDQGQPLADYDKLHLFDVEVADTTRQYRESDTFCPGNRITVVDTPFGRIGFSVCYDVRFADLYRALRLAGAEIILVPAAFTRVTGAAHWEVLLRARAIESQCYLLAAAQWGIHNDGTRETWGHSMVVDPWGRIVAQRPEGTGWLQAQLDMQLLAQIRQDMPVTEHNRFTAATLQPTRHR